MTTEVYGASDDLIEIDGDLSAEISAWGTDEKDHGVLIICSDGTLLDVKYGKNEKGIWGVKLVKRGSLFDRIDQCTDEDANRYSDTAHFRDGLKWAYAAKEWEEAR